MRQNESMNWLRDRALSSASSSTRQARAGCASSAPTACRTHLQRKGDEKRTQAVDAGGRTHDVGLQIMYSGVLIAENLPCSSDPVKHFGREEHAYTSADRSPAGHLHPLARLFRPGPGNTGPLHAAVLSTAACIARSAPATFESWRARLRPSLSEAWACWRSAPTRRTEPAKWRRR